MKPIRVQVKRNLTRQTVYGGEGTDVAVPRGAKGTVQMLNSGPTALVEMDPESGFWSEGWQLWLPKKDLELI